MRLELSLQLQQNFQEMLYILDSMEELKVSWIYIVYPCFLLCWNDHVTGQFDKHIVMHFMFTSRVGC